jgi:hypothetical protein
MQSRRLPSIFIYSRKWYYEGNYSKKDVPYLPHFFRFSFSHSGMITALKSS